MNRSAARALQTAPAPTEPLTPVPPTPVVARLTQGSLGLGVLRFGLPLAVGMILYTAFNLVDMFMIGRLENGTAGLAAIAITDMVAAVATILSTGISTAAVALVARRLGSGDRAGVARAIAQSLLLVAALSGVFACIGLTASDLVVRDVMQGKGEAADLAVEFLQINLGGCLSIFLLLQVTSLSRALGHATLAAVLLVLGNLLNVALNAVFIYGPGPHPTGFGWAGPIAELLGVPRFGVVGAAWATLVGRALPASCGLAWVLYHAGRGGALRLRSFRPRLAELRSLLVIGWPSSVQLVVRVGAILVFISLINGHFTTPADQSALTAYGICLRLETMALFVGMGWGAAASTYVGVNLGAGLPMRAHRAGWIAAGYNVALMVVLVLVYLLFTPEIVGIFDDSPRVIAISREYITTVGLSYCLIGLGLVLAQAMAGAGATLSVMLIDASMLLGLVIPIAIFVTATLGAPRDALWWTIAAGNVLGPLGSTLWYARGSFLAKRLA